MTPADGFATWLGYTFILLIFLGVGALLIDAALDLARRVRGRADVALVNRTAAKLARQSDLDAELQRLTGGER